MNARRPTDEEFAAATYVLWWLVDSELISPKDEGAAGHLSGVIQRIASKEEVKK